MAASGFGAAPAGGAFGAAASGFGVAAAGGGFGAAPAGGFGAAAAAAAAGFGAAAGAFGAAAAAPSGFGGFGAQHYTPAAPAYSPSALPQPHSPFAAGGGFGGALQPKAAVGLQVRHRSTGTLHTITAIVGRGSGGNVKFQPAMPVILGDQLYTAYELASAERAIGKAAGEMVRYYVLGGVEPSLAAEYARQYGTGWAGIRRLWRAPIDRVATQVHPDSAVHPASQLVISDCTTDLLQRLLAAAAAAPAQDHQGPQERLVRRVTNRPGGGGAELELADTVALLAGGEASAAVPDQEFVAAKAVIRKADVEAAVRAVMMNELAKHGCSEGSKAVAKAASSSRGPDDDGALGPAAGLVFSPEHVAAAAAALPASAGLLLSEHAAVFLAAVLEYNAAEILELSGNACRDTGSYVAPAPPAAEPAPEAVAVPVEESWSTDSEHVIGPGHVAMAVGNDEELAHVFTFAVKGGGDIPRATPDDGEAAGAPGFGGPPSASPFGAPEPTFGGGGGGRSVPGDDDPNVQVLMACFQCSANAAKKGIYFSRGDVEAAGNWVLTHMADPDIDAEFDPNVDPTDKLVSAIGALKPGVEDDLQTLCTEIIIGQQAGGSSSRRKLSTAVLQLLARRDDEAVARGELRGMACRLLLNYGTVDEAFLAQTMGGRPAGFVGGQGGDVAAPLGTVLACVGTEGLEMTKEVLALLTKVVTPGEAGRSTGARSLARAGGLDVLVGFATANKSGTQGRQVIDCLEIAKRLCGDCSLQQLIERSEHPTAPADKPALLDCIPEFMVEVIDGLCALVEHFSGSSNDEPQLLAIECISGLVSSCCRSRPLAVAVTQPVLQRLATAADAALPKYLLANLGPGSTSQSQCIAVLADLFGSSDVLLQQLAAAGLLDAVVDACSTPVSAALCSLVEELVGTLFPSGGGLRAGDRVVVSPEPERAGEPASEETADALMLDAPGLYEGKDGEDKWWPITLTGLGGDGSYTAEVVDSKKTKWPTVHPSNIQRVCSVKAAKIVGSAVKLDEAGVYEAKDSAGKWWPVTLTSRLAGSGWDASDGGSFTATVADPPSTKWPKVLAENMRLALPMAGSALREDLVLEQTGTLLADFYDGTCLVDLTPISAGRGGFGAPVAGCGANPTGAEVGMQVRLTPNYQDFSDAKDGPLKSLEDVGTIMATGGQTGKRFSVKNNTGHATWWYDRSALHFIGKDGPAGKGGGKVSGKPKRDTAVQIMSKARLTAQKSQGPRPGSRVRARKRGAGFGFANYGDGFYEATIVAVNGDGTCHVSYPDEGPQDPKLPISSLEPGSFVELHVDAPTAGSAAASADAVAEIAGKDRFARSMLTSCLLEEAHLHGEQSTSPVRKQLMLVSAMLAERASHIALFPALLQDQASAAGSLDTADDLELLLRIATACRGVLQDKTSMSTILFAVRLVAAVVLHQQAPGSFQVLVRTGLVDLIRSVSGGADDSLTQTSSRATSTDAVAIALRQLDEHVEALGLKEAGGGRDRPGEMARLAERLAAGDTDAAGTLGGLLAASADQLTPYEIEKAGITDALLQYCLRRGSRSLLSAVGQEELAHLVDALQSILADHAVLAGSASNLRLSILHQPLTLELLQLANPGKKVERLDAEPLVEGAAIQDHILRTNGCTHPLWAKYCQDLVGCRLEVFPATRLGSSLEAKQWHQGTVLQYIPHTGQHALGMEADGSVQKLRFQCVRHRVNRGRILPPLPESAVEEWEPATEPAPEPAAGGGAAAVAAAPPAETAATFDTESGGSECELTDSTIKMEGMASALLSELMEPSTGEFFIECTMEPDSSDQVLIGIAKEDYDVEDYLGNKPGGYR